MIPNFLRGYRGPESRQSSKRLGARTGTSPLQLPNTFPKPPSESNPKLYGVICEDLLYAVIVLCSLLELQSRLYPNSRSCRPLVCNEIRTKPRRSHSSRSRSALRSFGIAENKKYRFAALFEPVYLKFAGQQYALTLRFEVEYSVIIFSSLFLLADILRPLEICGHHSAADALPPERGCLHLRQVHSVRHVGGRKTRAHSGLISGLRTRRLWSVDIGKRMP